MKNNYQILQKQVINMLGQLSVLRLDKGYDPKNYRNIVNLLSQTYHNYRYGCAFTTGEFLALCQTAIETEISACNEISKQTLHSGKYQDYRNWVLALNQLIQIHETLLLTISNKTSKCNCSYD